MSHTFIFCGGGTGGHIYPAIAVAQAVEELQPNTHIEFVAANRNLDKKILSREKYKATYLNIGGLNTSDKIQKLKTLLLLPIAFFQALFLLLRVKPTLVLGFGGYASAPTLFVAKLLGIKIAIWEANMVPGMVTRYFSQRSDYNFLGFEDRNGLYPKEKTFNYGVPSRFQPMASASDDGIFRVLIFGGSSGARAINHAIYDAMLVLQSKRHPLHEQLDKISFVHQIGSLDYKIFKEKYKKIHINIDVREFIYNMAEELAKADLVICRSGASTIAEVSMTGKAALFIPLPSSADNHQLKNAESLALQEAALLLEQKNLYPDKILDYIMDLYHDSSKQKRLEQNIQRFSPQKSSYKIAETILKA